MSLPTGSMILNVRADTGVTLTAGRISGWADQSGAGNDVVEVSGKGPKFGYAFGKAAAVYDLPLSGSGLSDYRLTFNAAMAYTQNAMTFMAVLSNTETNAVSVPAYFGSNLWILSTATLWTPHYQWKPYGWGAVDTGLYPLATPQVIVCQISPTGKMACNEKLSPANVFSPPSGAASGGAMGYSSATGYVHAGAIFQEVIWNRVLSDAEVQAAIATAAADWGINLAPTMRIVFDGDSRTSGTGCAMNNNVVAGLAPRFPQAEMLNMGVPGYKATDVLARIAIIDSLYDATKTCIYVLHCGVNDIYHVSSTPAETWANIQTALASVLKNPWKIVLCTCPRFLGSDATMTTFNALIRAGAATYGTLADLDVDTRIGGATAPNDTNYFYADGSINIHQTALGYCVYAEIIEEAIVQGLIGAAMWSSPVRTLTG